MRITWDGTPLPAGVQVSLSRGTANRFSLRGPLTLAAQFEAMMDDNAHVLEVYDDEGSLRAKVSVRVEGVQVYGAAGSPDGTAMMEASGPAQGAMPQGGFFA